MDPHQEKLERTRRCKALWGQLAAALPARLRVEALLALQSASSTPSRPQASAGGKGGGGGHLSNSHREEEQGGWFVRAVRLSLTLTLAGAGGVEALLGALFNGNESSGTSESLPRPRIVQQLSSGLFSCYLALTLSASLPLCDG